MKITLITACFNSIATIKDAIESVKSQKLPDGVELEHLIIDGGSTDGTEKLATISERDRGMYDAINKGIKMASGDVIGILNADDVLASDDVIARIASEFNVFVDCVYGKVYFVNPSQLQTSNSKLQTLRQAPPVRRCFAQLWRPWMLQWGYMPPHPGIFIRKECFEKWGGYVPDKHEYRIAADYELLIRFFRVHKMKAKYVKLYTTIMRTGGVSTKDVEARKKLNEEIIKANRTNGYFCTWPMLLPKYLIKIWEFILPRLHLM